MKIRAIYEVHLLNRWISLLKTLDSRSLRMMRANLQLIPKLFTVNSSHLFTLGPRYPVCIPVLHSSVEYAMRIGISISWKQIADHPGTNPGNPEERKEDLRVILLMRTLPIRKLAEELQQLHLRFADVYEMMSFEEQHKRLLVSGTLSTFIKSSEHEEYGADTYRLTMTSKKGNQTKIDFSQARNSARKIDNMPLIKAGSILLVTMKNA